MEIFQVEWILWDSLSKTPFEAQGKRGKRAESWSEEESTFANWFKEK